MVSRDSLPTWWPLHEVWGRISAVGQELKVSEAALLSYAVRQVYNMTEFCVKLRLLFDAVLDAEEKGPRIPSILIPIVVRNDGLILAESRAPATLAFVNRERRGTQVNGVLLTVSLRLLEVKWKSKGPKFVWKDSLMMSRSSIDVWIPRREGCE